MSKWTAEAKKVAAGKWVRFDVANPIHTLTFLGEPEKVQKTSQQGPTAGEKYFQMSFPVLLEGEEKILEPNRSLLTQLIEEDEEETIIGAELMIKCLNPEKKTQWKIRRIAGSHNDVQTWMKQKKPAQEEEEEEEAEEKKPAKDDKDKEKFMAEVEKRKKKKSKKEEKPAEPESEDNDDRSAEETGEA